ncbi:MAG: hypothetical protein II969_00895 [Anaerolineaceae bacterium]|nr:hypothetical protein [Anaerolineaceae bacterium]
MKGKILSVLIALLFIGSFPFSAAAQDEDNIINPKQLLEIADTQYFPLMSFGNDFSEDQGYVNEFPNPLTLHQYYIYDGVGTDLLMTINPSEQKVHTTNKRLKFDQYRAKDFHVTLSVERTENIPDSEGGICWIRYSNVLFTGEGKENGLIIYPGDRAYFFKPVDGELVYEEAADLSELNADRLLKFDFIRLDGTIYVYVNERFVFSAKDEFNDYVSFEAGSELYAGGNRIHCTFDDFSIKMR